MATVCQDPSARFEPKEPFNPPSGVPCLVLRNTRRNCPFFMATVIFLPFVAAVSAPAPKRSPPVVVLKRRTIVWSFVVVFKLLNTDI